MYIYAFYSFWLFVTDYKTLFTIFHFYFHFHEIIIFTCLRWQMTSKYNLYDTRLIYIFPACKLIVKTGIYYTNIKKKPLDKS